MNPLIPDDKTLKFLHYKGTFFLSTNFFEGYKESEEIPSVYYNEDLGWNLGAGLELGLTFFFSNRIEVNLMYRLETDFW